MLPSSGRPVRISIIFITIYLAPFSFGRAQNLPPAADATVKSPSLAVYSATDDSSDLVQSLKKGDPLLLGIEVQTSKGSWCSIRLPGQNARLGYARCDGIERKTAVIDSTSASASAAPRRSSAGGENPAAALPRVPIRSSGQPSDEFARVQAEVVHDDTLDGAKISELERAAGSGSTAAMSRAALARLAAGEFELSHGDTESAVDQLRAGVPFAAKQREVSFTILMMLSYVLLVRSEYSTALEYLARAKQIFPNSAGVAQYAGQAYYGLNRTDDAIREWQAAQRIAPNPNVAAWLEKAERDRDSEAGTEQRETGHFVLRYQGGATPALAAEVLHTLEEQFRSLASSLDFTPVEPIGVVLYTQTGFRDITRAPSWAGGINDGRIRIPVAGLNSVTPEFSRVLHHELTHSFVHQMSLGRCPTWFNEGLAQWMEGRRSAESARSLLALYDRNQMPTLDRMEGPWNSLSANEAGLAYAWSLAAVEYILSRSGPWSVQRIFGNLNSASSFEAALQAAIQTNYADLQKETADYLRKTYGQ